MQDERWREGWTESELLRLYAALLEVTGVYVYDVSKIATSLQDGTVKALKM